MCQSRFLNVVFFQEVWIVCGKICIAPTAGDSWLECGDHESPFQCAKPRFLNVVFFPGGLDCMRQDLHRPNGGWLVAGMRGPWAGLHTLLEFQPRPRPVWAISRFLNVVFFAGGLDCMRQDLHRPDCGWLVAGMRGPWAGLHTQDFHVRRTVRGRVYTMQGQMHPLSQQQKVLKMPIWWNRKGSLHSPCTEENCKEWIKGAQAWEICSPVSYTIKACLGWKLPNWKKKFLLYVLWSSLSSIFNDNRKAFKRMLSMLLMLLSVCSTCSTYYERMLSML